MSGWYWYAGMHHSPRHAATAGAVQAPRVVPGGLGVGAGGYRRPSYPDHVRLTGRIVDGELRAVGRARIAVAVGRARVTCGREDDLTLGGGLGEEVVLGAEQGGVRVGLAAPPARRDNPIGVGVEDRGIHVQDLARVGVLRTLVDVDSRLRGYADDVLDVEGRLAGAALPVNVIRAGAAIDRYVVHDGVSSVARLVGSDVCRRVVLELHQRDVDTLAEVALRVERRHVVISRQLVGCEAPIALGLGRGSRARCRARARGPDSEPGQGVLPAHPGPVEGQARGLHEIAEADDSLDVCGHRRRDARCRQGRERLAPAGQPVAHEVHVKGAVDRRNGCRHRDRKTVPAHRPGTETIPAQYSFDRGDLRQWRSE